jgi:hypothetical protein
VLCTGQKARGTLVRAGKSEVKQRASRLQGREERRYEEKLYSKKRVGREQVKSNF